MTLARSRARCRWLRCPLKSLLVARPATASIQREWEGSRVVMGMALGVYREGEILLESHPIRLVLADVKTAVRAQPSYRERGEATIPVMENARVPGAVPTVIDGGEGVHGDQYRDRAGGALGAPGHERVDRIVKGPVEAACS